MNGEILAIGTELLMGEIVDTNSAFIAQRAPAFGIEVRHVTLVGDNLDDMVESVNRGIRRSNILFITGGLGPTDDDLTRESIAKALGEELRVDPEALEQIRTYIEGRGGTMPPSNAKQASTTPLPGTVAAPATCIMKHPRQNVHSFTKKRGVDM